LGEEIKKAARIGKRTIRKDRKRNQVGTGRTKLERKGACSETKKVGLKRRQSKKKETESSEKKKEEGGGSRNSGRDRGEQYVTLRKIRVGEGFRPGKRNEDRHAIVQKIRI